MDPVTRDTYRSSYSFSFRLHELARRHRARQMGALFARLVAKVTVPRLPRLPALRWG